MALTYIVERAHPNYAGRLPLAAQARLIRGADGLSGANIDYLVSTLRHLSELGIRERELERLQALVGTYAARGAGRSARSRERGGDGAGVRQATGAGPAAQGRGCAALLLSHGADHARRLSGRVGWPGRLGTGPRA